MNDLKEPISWEIRNKTIMCYQGEKKCFSDDLDHWNNAVLRLLNLEDGKAREWIEEVILSSRELGFSEWGKCTLQQKVASLKKATLTRWSGGTGSELNWQEIGEELLGRRSQFHGYSLGWDKNFMVLIDQLMGHGVLIDLNTSRPSFAGPIEYEEDYFEGSVQGVGYGGYLDQQRWRIEKSHRLLRQIVAIINYAEVELGDRPHVLDIGSGYGFFRKELDEKGWAHDGIEVSNHAIELAASLFGFVTFKGTLESVKPVLRKSYDIITLFDVIEHVSNPGLFLREIIDNLKPDGLVIIRTPNIGSLELEVFGPHYHSFKREHLQYFSCKSLCTMLLNEGFKPLFMTTESHLLRGFFGRELVYFSNLLRGSDIFCIAQKE